MFEPPQAGSRYVIGVDTSEGLANGDASVAQVLKVANGEQVAVYHDRIPPDELADVICRLGTIYNTALLGIESNNHGLTTIVMARRLGYPNIYRRTQLNTVWSGLATVEFGWRTTRQSKALAISDLDAALRNREVIVRDEATLNELASYQRDARGRMIGLPHDDRVMALAIANQMRLIVDDTRYAPMADDYMTLAWWERQGREPQADDFYVGTSAVRGRS